METGAAGAQASRYRADLGEEVGAVTDEFGGVAYGVVELRSIVFRPTYQKRANQTEAEFVEWVKHRHPYPLIIMFRVNAGGVLCAEVETTIPPNVDFAGLQYLIAGA